MTPSPPFRMTETKRLRHETAIKRVVLKLFETKKINKRAYLPTMKVCGFILLFILLVVVLQSISIVSSLSCASPNEKAQERSKHLPPPDRVADIVVTMTTLPHRVDSVLPLALHSLRLQTVAPKAIEINIPFKDKQGLPYELPQWLREEEKASRVHIYRVIDMGPATKYIPTLQRYVDTPDQRILVVDDDMIIHHRRVEEFDAASQRYPDDVLAAHGLLLDKLAINHLHFVQPFEDVKTRLLPGASSTVEQPVDIVCGFQNYLLKPRFVNLALLTDYTRMPPAAFWVDDVVVSGHLAQQKVTRRIPKNITGLNRQVTKQFWGQVYSACSGTLNSQNLSTGANAGDTNNNIMIQFYKDFW